MLGVEQVERVAGLVDEGPQERGRHLVERSVARAASMTGELDKVASAKPTAPSRGTVSWSNMMPKVVPCDDPTSSHSRHWSPVAALWWVLMQGLQLGVGQGRVVRAR